MEYKPKTTPFTHQQEGFDRFKDASIVALNADMGVGKSKIGIDIVGYRNVEGSVDRVVIIAPNGVHDQWISEQFPEHCGVPWSGYATSSSKAKKVLRKEDGFFWDCYESDELKVLAINIEAFVNYRGSELVSRIWKTAKKGLAIIVDEASIIKTPDIKTVKNVKKLRDTYPDALRITMTGTPAAKGPVNMWSIYDFLRRNYMGCSYVAFRMMHTIIYKTKFMQKGQLVTKKADMNRKTFDNIKAAINVAKAENNLNDYAIQAIKLKFGLSDANFWHVNNSSKFVKYKGLDKLAKKIEPDTYSVKKSDCLNLPPKIYKKVLLKLNPEQKRLIKELEKYAIAIYNDEELTVEIKALLRLRVLQICGGFFSHHTDIEGEFDVTPIKGKNAKLEYIKQDLIEVGEQQAIIWAVYTPEVELIYETLLKDYDVGRLDGTVTGDDRVEVVRAFKAGEIQHLVAHPEVGGFGYNFQCATVQYWYSRNYRTEKRIQAEDRNYRIGTTESVVYKDLLYNIKAETEVYDTVDDEAKLNELFISSDIKSIFSVRS